VYSQKAEVNGKLETGRSVQSEGRREQEEGNRLKSEVEQ